VNSLNFTEETMTVKITLEYRTIEEATIALGKLGGLLPTKDSPAQVNVNPPVVDLAATTRPRRGRPPRKNTPPETPQVTRDTTTGVAPASPAAPSVAAPVESPVSAVQSRTADATKTPEAAPSKLEDVQAALERVFNEKGAQAAITLLADFGHKRARDLPVEFYGKFMDEAKKLLETK
jgi:hypothetical protein